MHTAGHCSDAPEQRYRVVSSPGVRHEAHEPFNEVQGKSEGPHMNQTTVKEVKTMFQHKTFVRVERSSPENGDRENIDVRLLLQECQQAGQVMLRVDELSGENWAGSKGGITFSTETLPKLILFLKEAEKQARESGLFPDGTITSDAIEDAYNQIAFLDARDELRKELSWEHWMGISSPDDLPF